jgi:MFS family permease
VLGSAIRRQLGLVRRATSFRLLFFSTVVSGLGTWMAVIALTVDVFDRTHSAKWVSALLIADFLPVVLIGLTLSPLVDRISRKLLMVGADVVRLAVFLALPFADSALRIVILAGVAGFATGFARPAAVAGLPSLVAEDDLPAANSLLRALENVMITAGTLLGGALTGPLGPHPVYGINAASFAISALLLLGLPGDKLRAAESHSKGHARDLLEGFALVARSRPVLAVAVAWTLMALANGTVNVAEVALAKVSYGTNDFGFGLLWAASGVGLIVGAFFAAESLARRGLSTVYGTALALMAFGFAGAAAAPDVWVGIWCMAISGLGNGAVVVYIPLLVQRGVPDALRGRAYTVLYSAYFTLLGGGMIAAGPFTDRFGARWAYTAAAVIGVLSAAAGLALARGVREEPAREAEPVPAA